MIFNRNSYFFIQENAFGYVVCETSAILSRPQCVNVGPFKSDGHLVSRLYLNAALKHTTRYQRMKKIRQVWGQRVYLMFCLLNETVIIKWVPVVSVQWAHHINVDKYCENISRHKTYWMCFSFVMTMRTCYFAGFSVTVSSKLIRVWVKYLIHKGFQDFRWLE